MAWGLRQISSQELTEWMAYYTLEPFGEDRADYRAAIVAATVANSQRDPKRRSRPYEPAEFLPEFGRPRKQQTWQEMLQIVEVINRAMGGRDLRKKKPVVSSQ